MKDLFLGNNTKPKTELIFTNLIIQFYLFRTAVPFFKYPFIILYSVLLIYLIFTRKDKLFISLKSFVSNSVLILILIVIFCIAFVLSDKIYLSIFKDLMNVIILLSVFFVLTVLIDSKKELHFFITSFINTVILFALLISFLGLLNLLGIYENSIDDYSRIDYNFALLPIFFGIISIIYLLTSKNLLTYQKILYNFLLCIFSLHIFITGSRRGLIVLTAIFSILLISQLFLLLKKSDFLRKMANNSKYSLLSLTLMTLFFYFFTFHTSSSFKNQALVLIGSKNISLTKRNITSNLYKYASVFNNTSSYSDFYDTIWTCEFNPKDPESGWGYVYSKRVFPLKGSNVEIVPIEAIGCLVDSISYVSGDQQAIYSLVRELEVKEMEKYEAGIYCYVSDDFDGQSVRFLLAWKAINSGVVSHNPISYYDLEDKGKWQKLNMEFDCNDGIVPIYISILKNKKKDFSKMKGYVIFAYPEYNKVELNDSSLSLLKGDKLFSLNKNNNDLLPSSKSELSSSNISITYMRAELFNIPFSYLANVALTINDKDPIRNWAAKFISEDTTYYGYKSDLFVDTVASKFSGPRIVRWQFAWQIFTKEYTLSQKLFGGGFNFLNWYGYYFLHDKTKSDYPHNPFLHVLLYSGVLGLILYIYFMYKVFYYYIKYIKEYSILFIFFLITFFFTFFSGGNPFDPPIMGFFVILPFFIHSVHKNSISE